MFFSFSYTWAADWRSSGDGEITKKTLERALIVFTGLVADITIRCTTGSSVLGSKSQAVLDLTLRP